MTTDFQGHTLIVETGDTSTRISQAETVVVERPLLRMVEVVAAGPQGPRGLTGPPVTEIADVPISMTDLTPGDVIVYDGTHWTNENKQHISDGGNF